jgi:hypothetical protein
MSSKHQVSASPAGIRLPVGERMTNGAYLFADENPDALGQVAKAENDLFNWTRPSIIWDRWDPTGFLGAGYSGAGTSLIAEYVVPMWPSGVGGLSARQQVIGKVKAKITSSSSPVGTGEIRVDVITSRGPFSQTVEVEHDVLTEYTLPAWAIYDGNEIITVRLHVEAHQNAGSTGTAANAILVYEFRLDWVPRTDHLLSVDDSGKYGGEAGNNFLPNDAESLRTNYSPGSVERGRRLLVDAHELLVRRTPQPIVTFSELHRGFWVPAGTTSAPIVLGRTFTWQLPYVNAIEIWLMLRGFVRVKIGPWEASFNPGLTTGISWYREIIPVERIERAEFQKHPVRLFSATPYASQLNSGGGAVNWMKVVSAFCAWWRIL